MSVFRNVVYEVIRTLQKQEYDDDEVYKLLERYRSDSREWEKYTQQQQDPMILSSKLYTRNLIYGCSDFQIHILVWPSGVKSPIHDHKGCKCWVKVLDGELDECIYDKDKKAEREGNNKCIVANDICYIDDSIGRHAMCNKSDNASVSLHVYTGVMQGIEIFQNYSCEFAFA